MKSLNALLGLPLIGLPLFLCAQSYTAPAGWKVVVSENEVTAQPEDLPNGKIFVMTLGKAKKPEGDFMDWLTAETDRDVRRFGTVSSPSTFQPIQTDIGVLYSRVLQVKTSTGTYIIGYFARKPSTGAGVKVGCMRSNDVSLVERHLSTALKILSPGLFYEVSAPEQTPPAPKEETIAINPDRPVQKPAVQKASTPKVAPGRVILVMEMSIGMGGMPYHRQYPYWLGEDGFICKAPDASPDAFDAQAIRQENPKDWGSWRKSGNKILVSWNNGKKDEWDRWIETVPGKPSQRLNAGYHHVSGASSPDYNTIFYSFRNFYGFFSNGRFETNKGAYVSGGSGGQTTAGAGNYKSAGGRYEIQGNAIDLVYDSGENVRLLFYFGAKPDKSQDPIVIGIGRNVFYLDE